MKRKEQVTTFSGYMLEGSVDEAITFFTKYKAEYGGDAEIEFDTFDPYSDAWSFELSIQREETVVERNERLQKEHDDRERQEARERQQYEALKAKFHET